MVWKSCGGGSSYNHSSPVPTQPVRREMHQGNIVASIGTPRGLEVENVYKIDNELLGYNLFGGKVLLRFPQNDSSFEQFISLSFTKGVTERETGRTMLILGSNAHHVEAMQYQFQGVLWVPSEENEIKKFGNTIRWINVGDTKNGFIGLDYNPQAPKDAGVARNAKDVYFLAQTLMDQQFDPKKRFFLLKPPYIQEREEGRALRREGLDRLDSVAKIGPSLLSRILQSPYDIEISEDKNPSQIYPLPTQG